jgi:hypothetical protein
VRQAKHQTEDIQTEAVIQEVVEIMWDSKGYNNGDRFMEIGNAEAYHRQERGWWAQGSGSAQAMKRWRQCIQNCHDEPQASMPATVKISDSQIQLHLKDHNLYFSTKIYAADEAVEPPVSTAAHPAREHDMPPEHNTVQRETGYFFGLWTLECFLSSRSR